MATTKSPTMRRVAKTAVSIISPATKAEKQRALLDAKLPLGYSEFERLKRVGEDVCAIYKNPQTGRRAIFSFDDSSKEVVFFDDYLEEEPAAEQAQDNHSTDIKTQNALVAIPSVPLVQVTPQLESMHPIAQSFSGLSENDQKSYWKSIGHLPIFYDAETAKVGRLIGFQNTDAGPVGAIFADDFNNRILYCISFKSGAPYRLGTPRPKRSEK